MYDELVNLLPLNKNINVVDVGARNGMTLLGDYSQYCNYYGFEPNPEEYKKLITDRTDRQLSKKGLIPKFKKSKYFCKAISNEINDLVDFYIKENVGSSTLSGKTNSKITNNIFVDDKETLENHHATNKIITTNTDTIDNIFSNEQIDFLKIDCEGFDYFVLFGSNNLLENKKILVIKTEVFFFSIYENKTPTLADQMIFLKSKGYRMIYIDFDHKGYLLDGIKFPLSCDKRPILWADAYFIPDFQNIELSDEKCLRLSLMLSELKFN